MTYSNFKRLLFKFALIRFLLIQNHIDAKEEFEGIIVSVNSEAITTFDLSERIKLVLKALNIDDNIENRDSVRERVLELLIIEKIKKEKVLNAKLSHTDEELTNFISAVYAFPKEEYNSFKKYVKEEGLDLDVILDQLSTELLWRKFSQQKFSSMITINQDEVKNMIESYKKKAGKIEYNLSEIFIENKSDNSWADSEKRTKKIITMLKNGSEFDTLASKFSDSTISDDDGNVGWIVEDNIDENIRRVVVDMKKGDFKGGIKTSNGYKIIKLLDKRKISTGSNQKVSFIRISSFDQSLLNSFDIAKISCKKKIDENDFTKGISINRIDNIFTKDLSEIYLNEIQKKSVGEITNEIEVDSEYTKILICEKIENNNNTKKRNEIEAKLIYEKYNKK